MIPSLIQDDTLNVIEFGDFQTPTDLARSFVELVFQKISPNIEILIEPTCGVGNVLFESLQHNSNIKMAFGFDINPDYVKLTKKRLQYLGIFKFEVSQKDFFSIQWNDFGEFISEKTLFIGNPPWVTNSMLAKMGAQNHPVKLNFQNYSGLDAMTGKSNFDISEWIMICIAELVSKKHASMAFLLKTSVARKIFAYIAKHNLNISSMAIYDINAKKDFSVNVDACLFVAEGSSVKPKIYSCPVYDSFTSSVIRQTLGYLQNKIIANIVTYEKVKSIDLGSEFVWRSGIKHDCSKVMELTKDGENFINGYQKVVDLPEDYLYPLYKSSDIAKLDIKQPRRFVIITQKKIGERTDKISYDSPATWDYLISYKDQFSARKSSIYRKAEPFSIFGVGDYSFSPWKIVISGLYKKPVFNLIGKYLDKPIFLDDTCYFLSFDDFEKAQFIYYLLSSELAAKFISSIIFQDSKRPITASLLNRINLREIALKLNLKSKYDELFENNLPKQLKINFRMSEIATSEHI
jgi:hypothetical protein